MADFKIALEQLAPELKSKLNYALPYNWIVKPCLNKNEFEREIDKNQYLWCIIAPNAISVTCKIGRTKKSWQYGRIPNNTKIFSCEDNSMIMGTIQILGTDNNYHKVPIVSPELNFDLEKVSIVIETLNMQSVILPLLSEIMAELGVIKLPENIQENLSKEEITNYIDNLLNIVNKYITYSIEEAYNGNIVEVPKVVYRVEILCKFINMIKDSENIIYEIPDNIDKNIYIQRLLCILNTALEALESST